MILRTILAATLFTATAIAAPARPPAAKTRPGRPVRKKPAPRPVAPVPAPAPVPAIETPTPAPEPAAVEAPKEPAPAPVETPLPEKPATNVEALRAEYEALKDALFRSGARRETLEKALFSTQLLPTIRWKGAKHHLLKRAEVRFDGVRLWESASVTGDAPVALAARSAPPGPHVLGVRIEVRGREDARRGYVSEHTFSVSLPEGKKTHVLITLDEDGSSASYEPTAEIEVESD